MDEYSVNNRILFTFINRQKQWTEKTYKTKHIGHGWVREKSKEQHYHVYLIIDGDIIYYWAHKKLRCQSFLGMIFILKVGLINIQSHYEKTILNFQKIY